MQRLEAEAGVTYDDVTLDGLPAVTARVFESLHSFAVKDGVERPDAPTFVAADERRHRALRRSVAARAPHWSDAQQETAAALLDVLWNLPSYERLVSGWRWRRRSRRSGPAGAGTVRPARTPGARRPERD